MAVQKPALVQSTDPAVEAELDRLAFMPIVQLRLRYRELFREDPPAAFGPDLLRKSVAHRIQEKVYGGLSRPVQRLLGQLLKAYAAKPNGRIVLPRRIKPGSVLVRDWKGKSHHVVVEAAGFIYEGNAYTNLSEIAGLITGTRWNGPRFFGLRSKQDGGSSHPDRHKAPKHKVEAALRPNRRDVKSGPRPNASPAARLAGIGNRHGR